MQKPLMKLTVVVPSKLSLMNSMALHHVVMVRQKIKEIDTGEVFNEDEIELSESAQAKALSADERHILADPKLLAKHLAKLEKKCSRLPKSCSLSKPLVSVMKSCGLKRK